MRKLTLILCLFITTSLQAQTKEETIIWLKEKLEKCLVSSSAYDHNSKYYTYQIQVNVCEITITVKMENQNETELGNLKKYYEKIIVPVAARLKVRSTGTSAYFQANTSASIIKKSGYRILGNNERKDWDEFSQSAGVSIKNMEENIFERINKALAHLTTFCPQKKEAF